MRQATPNALRIWIGPGVVWLALMLLLAATVSSAYVPLGALNSIVNMAIAAAKVALVMLFFMQIKSSSAMIRLAAFAALFWLVLMFSLTASDYLTRQ
jgi:cytochrome c oxidase subunit 4